MRVLAEMVGLRRVALVMGGLLSLGTACGPATPEVEGPSGVGTVPQGSGTPKTGEAPQAKKPALPEVQTTLAAVGLSGEAMDRSVNACTDFYQYACGGWLKKTEIPGDEASWYRSFSEIEKHNEETLKKILEDAVKSKDSDPVVRQLGDFYGSCMDEAAVDAQGVKPIADLLAKAKKVSDAKSIGALVAELHQKRMWALFSVLGEQDLKDATRVIANMDQSGLGLVDRDQYLDKDDKAQKLRTVYEEHVANMMKLAGYSEKDAKQAAKDVMALETELAKVSKTRVERRDPQSLYNKFDKPGLIKLVSAFPWDDYFKSMGLANISEVNLMAPKFFEGVNALLGSQKPEVWRNYLAWTVVRSSARTLSKAFINERFKLAQALTGMKELPPRWRTCVQMTDDLLGEVLGQAYVKVAFAGESKTAAENMVREISATFARNVNQLDWMDQKTKAKALEKLQSMAYLIGYPNKWRSYDFKVESKSFAKNVLAAQAFEEKRSLAKIGKPFDRDEWQMSPPAVNAYYDPQRNHMVFPAGILQPPFYSVKSSIPVNLGGVGMVVGHELTHGFDDEGSQFAGNGNLENWWDPKVGDQFKAKTGCVSDQYSAFEVQPGLKVNGKLTLGENIADLGGLKLAFYAYRAMRRDAKEMMVADGLNEDQQFFLAHGQSWCSKMREEAERLQVQTNPHSPSRFRVIGPVMNMPEFAEAFSCAPGTPMRPANKCAVW